MPARSLASRASGVPTYVDGGAQVCLITEDTARILQLKINRKHAYNITMENNAVVRCVGVPEQVDLYVLVLGQQVLVDLHVMPARPRAYPLILGRPWLMGMRVRQDWHRGELKLYTDKPHGQRVKSDMKTGQLLYFPYGRLEEEEQDDVEEISDEESFFSSEEDEFDDEYEELHIGVDLCGIGLEHTKS